MSDFKESRWLFEEGSRNFEPCWKTKGRPRWCPSFQIPELWRLFYVEENRMTEICAKVLKLKAPTNLKKVCDVNKNENEIVKQLREKAHKLKFRLLDIQNQNQILRKELKIAKKVLSNEIPEIRGGEFRGNEEEAVCLRIKIAELQKQIEELEGTSDERKDGKIAYPEEDTKHRAKSSNQPKKQSPTEQLVAGCVEVKAKLEYWKNRNAELEKLSEHLRLELNRLLDKGEDNRRIQSEYAGLERELRARQAERLEMRCKLDTAKTKNGQLSEEVALLREDVDRIRSKTEDDNMLREALTSQQGNFQDLIERQKLLGESDHRRFREDLRGVQVKYTTSCNMLEQLKEISAEKESVLHELQDYKDLLTYAKDEMDEKKENCNPNLPEMATKDSENPEDPQRVETDPMPPPDPELWDECEKFVRYFISAQEEVEQLAEIAINNNRKLNEWQEQLRQSKTTSAQKNAELRGLQESIKTQEGLTSFKGGKPEADTSCIMDELLIKLDNQQEIHRFMASYWHIVSTSTDSFFQIYATGADRTTKNFIDCLREKKKAFEKQPSVEEIAPQSSNTENNPQSP
ncbi:hypothetical protein AVEN_34698-1 [Araneus ventricosus]|uniref:Uncharacterized protein n=1 Tax=Araneus ventricosus TaxID=182803 RepID=A0A4Y2B3B6_ARAVE|nr:hypothetical protein AVEN_34698-1 [Araneus ventricosus]